MTFEEVRDQLISEGRTFSEDALRELPYRDLDRAWIGDAGAAACRQELVQRISLERVEDQAWKIIHLRMHPNGPVTITDPELFAAAQAFIEHRTRTPAEWDSLSPITQTYLLLRCLRAHFDTPNARLLQLAHLLQQLRTNPDQDTVIRCLALLTRNLLVHRTALNPEENLLRFRHDTYELFKNIRSRIPPQDAEACSHLEIAGYHCSNGCFLPGAME